MQEVLDVPENVIYLKQMEGFWCAIQTPSAFMMDLFGTNILPTPFTAKVDAEHVQTQIQERNPDMFVMVIA